MSQLLSALAAIIVLFGSAGAALAGESSAAPMAATPVPAVPFIVPAHQFGLLASQPADLAFEEFWVAAHAATPLWAGPSDQAPSLGAAEPWTMFKVLRPQRDDRLLVWNPRSDQHAWIDARNVGPVDPAQAGTANLPPIDGRVVWSGAAKVTMYTCVELGGCNRTASGVRAKPGVVAVDPRLIPLGARVWIQGLGTFLAADTGSGVKGAHIDVFSATYRDAIDWGIQRRAIVALD